MTAYQLKEVIGDATLYLGNCLDILPTLEKVDAVITDPPYGVTQNKWDDTTSVFKCFDFFSSFICTSQNPFSAALISTYLSKFRYSDVWEKSQATGFLNCQIRPMRKHEDILVFGDVTFNPQLQKKKKENIRPHLNTAQSSNYGKYKNERVRTIPIDMTYPNSVIRFENEQGTQHPTQKPEKLFNYLVRTYSNYKDVISDPFMGSGTTGVACMNLGRKFIGIEIEPKYFDISCERIEQAQKQIRMFA